MDRNLVKMGLIGTGIGLIGGGVGAIVAECKRRKARKQLEITSTKLLLSEFDGMIKDAKIKILEKENEELKSKKSEEES